MDSRNYPTQAARFAGDTADHVMTVEHDDGLYRHIVVKKPGSSSYWFEVVTWPGGLTIRGDMGSWTWSRERDMLPFFASGSDINPAYWHEKVQAGRADAREFSEDLFRKIIGEAAAEHVLDLDDEVEDHYLPGDAPPEGTPSQRARAFLDAVRRDVLEDPDVCHDHGAHEAATAFEYDGWSFTDVWEMNFTDFTYQYLWCCFAVRWVALEFARRAATASVEVPA